MWMQRSSHYTAVVGINLLAHIHQLHSAINGVALHQNHPVDHLSKHVDFMGDHMDSIGNVIDTMSEKITKQDVKIVQLADMVNDMVGVTKAQKKELEVRKKSIKDHHHVMKTLTGKYVSADDHIEQLEQKVFPQVRRKYCMQILVY
jgi:hypothetical protein